MYIVQMRRRLSKLSYPCMPISLVSSSLVQGVGHLRRCSINCDARARATLSVSLTSGGKTPSAFSHRGGKCRMSRNKLGDFRP